MTKLSLEELHEILDDLIAQGLIVKVGDRYYATECAPAVSEKDTFIEDFLGS